MNVNRKEITIALLIVVFINILCQCARNEASFFPTEKATLLSDSIKGMNERDSRIWLNEKMKLEKDTLFLCYMKILYSHSFLYGLGANIDSAILYSEALARTIDTIDDSEYSNHIRMLWYENASAIYGIKFDSKKMSDYGLKAYHYARMCNAKNEDIIKIVLNVGDGYNNSCNFTESYYWYNKAKFLSDSLNLDFKEKLAVDNTMFRMHLFLKNYNVASQYAHEILNNYSSLSFFDKYYFLNNVGMLYYYEGQYEKSLSYYRRMYKLVNENPKEYSLTDLTACMVNLSDVYACMGKTDTARTYIQPALKRFTREKYESYYYYCQYILLRIAMKEHSLSEAKKYMDILESNINVQPSMKVGYFKYKSQLMKEMGDFKEAYDAEIEYRTLNDSLINEQVLQRIAEMQIRYDQDYKHLQAELKNANLKVEIDRWRRFTLFISVICLSLIFLILFLRWNKKIKAEKQAEKIRLKMSRLKMESVRNRISPHFLMNVLSQETYKNLSPQIENLVMLLRQNLSLVNKSIINLNEELFFIDTYVNIEKESFLDDNFVYEVIKEPNDIDLCSVSVPSMIVQIMVENAIKHALKPKEGLKLLRINVCHRDDTVFIKVTDNGGDFKFISKNGTGQGMRIITQTMELLNHQNKRQMSFSINNEKIVYGNCSYSGCCVSISIPDGFNFGDK